LFLFSLSGEFFRFKFLLSANGGNRAPVAKKKSCKPVKFWMNLSIIAGPFFTDTATGE